VQTRAGQDILDNRKISCPYWDVNPDHAVHSLVTILNMLL